MSGAGGWIALPRALRDHWLWSDPERLKWWLDLLFSASSARRRVMHDGKVLTLSAGQIIASRSCLSARWDRSENTIARFLQLLEEEGMIMRHMIGRHTSVITICGYCEMTGVAPEEAAPEEMAAADELDVDEAQPDEGAPEVEVVAAVEVPPSEMPPSGKEAPRPCAAPAGEGEQWLARAVKDDEFMGRLSEILGGSRGALEALALRFETERLAKGHTYPTLERYKEHLINWGRYNAPGPGMRRDYDTYHRLYRNSNPNNSEYDTQSDYQPRCAGRGGGVPGAAVAGRPDPRRPIPAELWDETAFDRPFA